MLQLNVDFATELMLQLATGVMNMHSQHVLHRDLRLENALVSSEEPLTINWGCFGSAIVSNKPYSEAGALQCLARVLACVCRFPCSLSVSTSRHCS